MEPMRWNNADSNPGARPQTSVFRGDKGLDVANQNRASGGGRKMFLTSPYIDQAIARFDRWSVSAMRIFHQPTSSVPQSSLAGTGTWFNIVRIRFRQRVWVPPHRVDFPVVSFVFTSEELMRNLEFVLTEPVDDINFYVNSGVPSITFKDRKSIRTETSRVPKNDGLLEA